MAYTDVDTAAKATRTAGDLLGRIGVALVKKAAIRIIAIVSTDSQDEYKVCRSVVQGTMPVSWTTMVLEVLDLNGVALTAAATDAQIDTAVNTAWAYFIKAVGTGTS